MRVGVCGEVQFATEIGMYTVCGVCGVVCDVWCVCGGRTQAQLLVILRAVCGECLMF